MNEFYLKQHFFHSTIIHQSWNNTDTTINLMFTIKEFSKRVIYCQIRDDLNHNSNHYFIKTLLNVTLIIDQSKQHHCWKRMNQKILHLIVQILLSSLSLIMTAVAIDAYTKKIIEVIVKDIEKLIFMMINSSQHSITKFNSQCKKTCQKTHWSKQLHNKLLRQMRQSSVTVT